MLCRADGAIVHVAPGAPCFDANKLRAQVHAWLGNTPVDGSLQVLVEEDALGERARFWVQRRGERLAERTFLPAPPGCAQREAVMALAIALVLKDTLLEELTVSAERIRARPRRITLSLLLLGSAGVLPAPAPGSALAFGWARERGFGLRIWLEGSTRSGISLAGAGGSFHASLASFGLEGCMHVPLAARLRTAFCAGVTTGLLTSRGHGFASSYRRLDGRAAGLVSVLFELPVSARVALLARLAAHGLLTPVQIEARSDRGELLARRELPPLGVDLALGPALVFR